MPTIKVNIANLLFSRRPIGGIRKGAESAGRYRADTTRQHLLGTETFIITTKNLKEELLL